MWFVAWEKVFSRTQNKKKNRNTAENIRTGKEGSSTGNNKEGEKNPPIQAAERILKEHTTRKSLWWSKKN